MDNDNILTWKCEPNARLKEDGLWYPSVVAFFMGFRQNELQYALPFKSESAALGEAKYLAMEQLRSIYRSVTRMMPMVYPPA